MRPWTAEWEAVLTHHEASVLKLCRKGGSVFQSDVQPLLQDIACLRIDKNRLRMEAPALDHKHALELVLLFHDGKTWTPAKTARWREITGYDDATTKAMCDHIRVTLGVA